MTAEDTAGAPRRFWIGMGAVCIVMAAMAAHQVSIGTVFNWFVAMIAALAIVGIVRRVRWGRRLAVGLQILLLLAGVGAVLPPEQGVPLSREMPPVEVAIAEAAALVCVALLCLHLLGLWKKSFRDAWI